MVDYAQTTTRMILITQIQPFKPVAAMRTKGTATHMKTFICPACRGALIDVIAGYCNTCRRTTVQTCISPAISPALYLVTDTTPAPAVQTTQRERTVFLSHSIGFA